ncbi:MAG TPA: FliM/FliN family flagellar motor switch protein [Solirubrobacterales bacterium]|jgi:flagellar motor switch protein FliM|nr:FliM/FliN family flagellar motor switch protein [Solirubrobacterales bacterium]
MKTIDFTRPTKFTPDHERRLGRALVAFCRTSSTRLSAELRLPIELDFVEATQLTWANAHDRLTASTLCAMVELQPVGTQVVFGVDAGFMLTGIESLLSGAPAEPPPDRRLTEIDLALARRIFDDMLGQMTVVWRDLTGTELVLVGIDSQMETAGIAPVSEPTLELAMRARMLGREFALTLLLPHRAIAPVEDKILGRRRGTDEAPDPITGLRLREAMSGIEVAVRAEIAGPQISATEVLGLEPGSTLRLGGRVDEGLGLCVEGVRVVRAKPGRSGSRRAVQVLEAVEPSAAEGLALLVTSGHRAGTTPEAEPDAALRSSLGQVPMRVWAELGQARLSLAEIVAFGVGAVVELDRRLDDPIDLYVNGLRLGHGELEIIDDEWAVRVDAVTGLGEPAARLG